MGSYDIDVFLKYNLFFFFGCASDTFRRVFLLFANHASFNHSTTIELTGADRHFGPRTHGNITIEINYAVGLLAHAEAQDHHKLRAM